MVNYEITVKKQMNNYIFYLLFAKTYYINFDILPNDSCNK